MGRAQAGAEGSVTDLDGDGHRGKRGAAEGGVRDESATGIGMSPRARRPTSPVIALP